MQARRLRLVEIAAQIGLSSTVGQMFSGMVNSS
jgi:hypothetical protein